MSPEVRAVIEAEVFCRCGQCEDAVQDILRMERMLCQGAKNILARRRNDLKRAARRPYFRDYDRQRRESPCRGG